MDGDTITVTYQVCDSIGACATADLVVTVGNETPVAVDDTGDVHTGASVDVDVRDNDSDADTGDTLADPTIVTPPASGTAVVQPDGTIRVTPAADAVDGDTITVTYQVCDDAGACVTADLVVTVRNAAPTAVDDAATVHAGASVDVDVLGNDSDADTGDTLADPTIVTPPTSGTAVVQPDGTIRVTPAADAVDGDTITLTYQVCDDFGACTTADLVVTVGNTAPVATDDARHVTSGSSVTVDVRANDSDPDEDELQLPSIVSSSAAAVVTVLSDGRIRVAPRAGTAPGTVLTVVYRVCDANGACDDATLSVTVDHAPPVVAPDTATVKSDGSVVIDVRGNDGGVDGETLGLPTITVPPTTGTARVNADGTITYTPAPGTKAGTVVTFTYRVCDSASVCRTAVVRITVGGSSGGGSATDDDPDSNDSDRPRLPFTGFDALLWLGAGFVLLAAGAVVVVAGRRRV